MPDLSPLITCEIIRAARAFHAKEEVVIPDEPQAGDEDWAMQVLADHESDLTYQEVKALIDDLDASQQVALVALMWLGRGDYDDFAAAAEEAARGWNPRTAEYLIATPLVADYLEEGLARTGHSCEE